jgi:hypothetical protein
VCLHGFACVRDNILIIASIFVQLIRNNSGINGRFRWAVDRLRVDGY